MFKDMTPAKLKKLLQVAKDLEVAELKIGDFEVKFYKVIKVPGEQTAEELQKIFGTGDVNDENEFTADHAPGSLKDSLNTHLEARSPSRAEQEHNADLFWST